MSMHTIGYRFRTGYGIFLSAMLCMILLGSVMHGCILSSGKDGGNGEEKPVDPAVKLLNIVDGQVVPARDVIIRWQGNKEASLYQYTFDSVTYDITPDTLVTMTDLDESAHTFIIQALNESQTKSSTPDSVTFTVDAIRGPGIVFSPRKITTESSVSIYLEDVNKLMAAHIELFCENRCVLFGEFTKNESLVGDGEVIVFGNNYSSQQFILDISFPGETGGLSGSMLKIGTLSFTSLRTGTITVTSSTVKFRDIGNKAIDINDLDFVRVVR